MVSDIVNERKYRVFGFSCKKEFLEEETIKIALDHKSIKGCAYILHEQDTIRREDIDSPNNDYTIKDLGKRKDPHWHIVIEVNPAQYISTIAKWFAIPENIVQKRLGAGAFRDYLAYLTHITKNSLGVKFEYDSQDVKNLRFPKKAWCRDLDTYENFKQAYLDSLLKDLSSWELLVAKGELTPDDVREKDLEFYINHIDKLDKIYRNYCQQLKLPKYRWNYYIHGLGGVGKGLTSLTLALSHLHSMFPDVDFDSMSKQDLANKGYVYWAGSGSTALQDYLGHPIIIWNDVRANTLIKLFGGTGNLFEALDVHPNPSSVKILYGKVNLVNSINIFNGIQSYDEFITGLSKGWATFIDNFGNVGSKQVIEDKSQAKRRFPFIIEVDESFISMETELNLLADFVKIDTKPIVIANDLQLLASHNKLSEISKNFAIGKKAIQTQAEVQNKLETETKLPENPCKELPEREKDL